MPEIDSAPLLEVRDVSKYFTVSRGGFGPRATLKAVDGASFAVGAQETFAVVGESGSGKSTLGRLIAALERPTGGDVLFEGRSLWRLGRGELRMLRRHIQSIFQDPYSSLNPRFTVREILSEPWDIHGLHRGQGERQRELRALCDLCGIALSALERYPHEFSGGQRQRVGIARALALKPRLLVADEPVSSLDVSIQAQIVNLLKDLQSEFHLAIVFISHDLSVVRQLADRVAVMYLGKIVELAGTEELLADPQHPYTEALLSAIPLPDPEPSRRRERLILPGDLPSPYDPPPGCGFHPRCRYAQTSCRTQVPELSLIVGGRRAACPVRPFLARSSRAAIAAP
jgi:peptide/nickel transport system ATP-binding protein